MVHVGNGDGIVHLRIIPGGGAAGNPIAKAAGLPQKGLDAMRPDMLGRDYGGGNVRSVLANAGVVELVEAPDSKLGYT